MSAAPFEDPALTQRFYAELRAIAQRLFASERAHHTLQPTALVHEACLRMLTSSPLPEASRAERLALAARVLKQVLIDHARARGAQKRSSVRVELDPELATEQRTFVDFDAIHGALERLAELHARQAEVVSLRVFGGLTLDEIAAAIGTSKRTAEADWAVARAWLRRELASKGGDGAA